MNYFQLTITRYYFAVASVIATFLIQRPLINSQWDSKTVFSAGASDLAIILLFVVLHWTARRFVRDHESIAEKVSAGIHATVASTILIFAVLSQLLFMKTGETLDIGIIEFALHHASALTQVAAGEISATALQPVFFAFSLIAIASLRLNRKILQRLTYSTLAVPIFLLPACNLAENHFINSPLPDPPMTREDSLYKGVYADLTDTQISWNTSGSGGWTSGIISGAFFGTIFGKLAYESYKTSAGATEIYGIEHVMVEERRSRPNVLMIVLESVRHDALGAYQAEPQAKPSVTPFIDEFASNSQVAEHAYTTIPHTSKALVGIYCGTFPRFNPEITEALPGGLSIPCLPKLLARAGYASAHFQTAPAKFENRDQLLQNMGFSHFTTQESFLDGGWERFGYLGLDDYAMIEPAIDWMRHQKGEGRPFFASMLTISTHHPYASPGNIKPVSSHQEAHAAYLIALNHTDSMLKNFFAQLEKNGLLQNTIVIITGDHGEGFGEHGQIAHNGTAYEEGMRIPLIIRMPHPDFQPTTIKGLRQHVDIAPTLLDAAGIRVTGAFPGLNLLTSDGHKNLITSCFYTDYCLTHINADKQKLVYLYGRRDVELYDLNTDPDERINLALNTDSEGDVKEQLLAAIHLRNSYELVWN